MPIHTIIPFKNAGPAAAFENTTLANQYSVSQKSIDNASGVISPMNSWVWGNSEAAFHAQKLIGYFHELKNSQLPLAQQTILEQQVIGMLGEIRDRSVTPGKKFMPNEYADIVKNTVSTMVQNDPRITNKLKNAFPAGDIKNAFDRVCGAHYYPPMTPSNPEDANAFVQSNDPKEGIVPRNYIYMKHVMCAKLADNPTLKADAIYWASNGVFPVEISQMGPKGDMVWSTGKNGNGKNLLGVAIIAAANVIINQTPGAASSRIPDPFNEWPKFAGPQNQVALSHDQLSAQQPLNALTFQPVSLPPTQAMQSGDRQPAVATSAQVAQQHSNIPVLLEKTPGPNGDRYFADQNSGISLVIRPDGGHHFSQNRKTIKVDEYYESAMLKALSLVRAQPPQAAQQNFNTPAQNSAPAYHNQFQMMRLQFTGGAETLREKASNPNRPNERYIEDTVYRITLVFEPGREPRFTQEIKSATAGGRSTYQDVTRELPAGYREAFISEADQVMRQTKGPRR